MVCKILEKYCDKCTEGHILLLEIKNILLIIRGLIYYNNYFIIKK